MAGHVHYDQVMYWYQQYGRDGGDDQRAILTFMDCETEEKVRTLRAQFYSISSGRYDQNMMDKQMGSGRRAKYGTYEAWAKLMLLWMAGHKG